MEELYKQNVEQRVNRRRNYKIILFIKKVKRQNHTQRCIYVWLIWAAYLCGASIKDNIWLRGWVEEGYIKTIKKCF